MKDLFPEDVKILDRMIELAVKREDNIMSSLNLPPITELFQTEIDYNPFFSTDHEKHKYRFQRNKEYQNYFLIIEEYNNTIGFAVVETHPLDMTFKWFIMSLKDRTKRFLDSGGFQNLYDKQEFDKLHEKKAKEKDINDAKISEWLAKDYKTDRRKSNWAFIISGVAVLVSVLANWKDILEFFKTIF